MKTIKINEFPHDGELINLETDYVPYEKLLYNPSLYLDKNKKVVSLLEIYGYDVTRVMY